MGLGGSNVCKDKLAVAAANKYLGTYYDTIQEVHAHLDDIVKAVELGELARGFQGNVPSITTNGDGTYTIHGHNGDVTISDGFSPTVESNGAGTGVIITDANDTETEILKGLRTFTTFAYTYSNEDIEVAPVSGDYDGTTIIYPDGFYASLAEAPIQLNSYIIHNTYTEQADGSWSQSGWSVPARINGQHAPAPQKGVDYFDGVNGVYTSFVFRAWIGQPPTPTNGSFNGIPDEEVFPTMWSDDAPEATGTQQIWFTVRRYTHNTTTDLWEGSNWTTPRLASGQSGYTPQKGVDYFDGVTGQYNSYIFRNATNQPPVPVGGSFDGDDEVIPADWQDDPSSPGAGQSTWISRTKYTVDSNGIWNHSGWSAPSRHSGYAPVKGVDYTDGVDGRFHSWIFKNAAERPPRPNGGSYDGTNEVIPNTWTDDPSAPAEGEFVWLSKVTYHKVGSVWIQSTAWSLPIKNSGENGYTPQYGVDYMDGLAGNFTSYIFRMSPTKPVDPVGGTFDGTVEVVPVGWYDDPSEPIGIDVLWVSKGVYRVTPEGTWINDGWSSPVQFTGSDGTAKFLSQIFITTDTLPTTPSGGSYDGITETFPTGWTDAPVEPNESQAVYTSFTTYTLNSVDDTWSHTGWSIPILFTGGIDVEQLESDVEDLNQSIDQILADIIWNTAHYHNTITDTGINEARINVNQTAITTESEARATQATQLQANIDSEGARVDAEIIRVDNVIADTAGNSSAITALEGTVNNVTTGVAATYTLASQAKTDSEDNASSLTALTNTVNHATTGLAATNTLASQAKITSDGNSSAITSLQGTVNDPVTGLGATYTIAGQAKTSAENNASSIVGLRTAVAGTDNQAQTELLLQTTVDAVNNELIGQAVLGVDVDGVFTGMSIVGGSSYSGIEFRADTITLSNSAGAPQLYYDSFTDSWIMAARIISFVTGEEQGSSITSGNRTALEVTSTSSASLVARTNSTSTAYAVDAIATTSSFGCAVRARGGQYGVNADGSTADIYAANGKILLNGVNVPISTGNSSDVATILQDLATRLTALDGG